MADGRTVPNGQKIMRKRGLLGALFCSMLYAQSSPTDFIAAITRNAEAFQQIARQAISDETLLQRSYRGPAHPHFAIGAAAEPAFATYVVNEIASQYAIGSLRGDESGSLLEIREIVAKNGKAIKTPEAARKALARDISEGAARIRKQMLREFTDLGLVDVATDYGLMLLAFTKAGLADIKLTPAEPSYIGAEETVAFEWRQTTGGLLEFRGRTMARRAMHGRIWVRRSDGAPLRISASTQHDEEKHTLRDDATIDYVLSSFGCVTPASVVHRHYVDEKMLTENLYTYAPFRLFSTDTTIRFGDSPR
jgi:hypothetical protein